MELDIVLETQNIHHWFGDHKVLFEIDLKIARGEIVGLVGPSGCGKSTLLRAITGTHLPHRGQVMIFPDNNGQVGKVVQGPGRDRGIVYQRYSLFPFLTAQKNVAIGLMLDETTLYNRVLRPFWWRSLRKNHLEESAELLERLGLGHAIHRYPHELSGGMCQRVAIAQALIMKPQILLLDEPFGALDEATREDLQRMLLTLYEENRAAKAKGEKPPYTIFIVTHELNEAIYVGDRVLGLSQYWDWKSEKIPAFPGATVIYDKPAPVYQPDQFKDAEVFGAMREEIRRVVFEEDHLQDRALHCTFWDEIESGAGQGILSP